MPVDPFKRLENHVENTIKNIMTGFVEAVQANGVKDKGTGVNSFKITKGQAPDPYNSTPGQLKAEQEQSKRDIQNYKLADGDAVVKSRIADQHLRNVLGPGGFERAILQANQKGRRTRPR